MIGLNQRIRRIFAGAALLAVSLSASAFKPAPLPPQPQTSEDVPVEIATAPVDQKRVRKNSIATIGNDSTFYVQASGGSAFTTILLGPIGALINEQNIKKRTAREATQISDAVPDARALLAAPVAAYNASARGATAKITPYFVYVRPKKRDLVYGRLTLDVEYAGWVGRYSYHYAPVTVEQFQAGHNEEQARAFAAETERGAAQLLRLFNAEAHRRTGPVESAMVSCWPLIVIFDLPLPLGLRGQFEDRPVLVGQGTPLDHKAMLSLMVGTHLIPADQFVVDKRKGEVPQL